MPQGPFLIVEDGSGHVVKGPTILKFIGAVVSRLTSNTAEITISGSGTPSLTATAATSNASGSLGTLPANAYILSAFFRNTTANAVNIEIGTMSGGSDVMSAEPVPPNGTLTVNPFESPNWFSPTATQALWISSTAWNSASINCELTYQLGI